MRVCVVRRLPDRRSSCCLSATTLFVQCRDKLMVPISLSYIRYTHFFRRFYYIGSIKGNGGTGSDNRAVKCIA